MSPKAVREYAAAIARGYPGAGKAEKGRVLDAFCATTGWHRKAAIRLLGRVGKPPAPVQGRGGRSRQYGADLLPALTKLWAVSGMLSGKLLVGAVADLVPKLERAGAITLNEDQRAALLLMSAATIDRLLLPERRAGPRQPQRSSPATTATIRQQVPLKTWTEWVDAKPGEVQADLVLHCGTTTAGGYLATLTVVDVATGWVELQPVWRLTQDRVEAALTEVKKRLPMALVALHTDNGSEFLNALVQAWCRRHGVRSSRGRPYRKNDQAYVEQRNWTAVRELVGYGRYESRAALAALGRLELLISDQLNFVRPMRKLVSKERVGARVTKRYDAPRTPYHRLLAKASLDPDQLGVVTARFSRCNPLVVAQSLLVAQQFLLATAVAPFDPQAVRVG